MPTKTTPYLSSLLQIREKTLPVRFLSRRTAADGERHVRPWRLLERPDEHLSYVLSAHLTSADRRPLPRIHSPQADGLPEEWHTAVALPDIANLADQSHRRHLLNESWVSPTPARS